MRILPGGDRALMVEFDTLTHAMDAYSQWRADPAPGIVELVPAARTVLVHIDPTVIGLAQTEVWLLAHAPARGTAAAAAAATSTELVTLPVTYNGEDLEVVAAAWGCSPLDVVTRHTAQLWVCAFIGFAPGFGYLVPHGEGPLIDAPPVPRRATSRPAVPAGSVALAAEFCGVYPRSSPGGWRIIGSTKVPLWSIDREPPALLTPGTRVRFEAVER